MYGRREEEGKPTAIQQAHDLVLGSDVNDIETKRREASIMGIFAKSK
jgi:hypothetical protein